MEGDHEDYWNTSANKAFSFDECDDISPTSQSSESKSRYRLIPDDNVSEVSFELVSAITGKENELLPLNAIISEDDLKTLLEEQSLEDTPFRKGMTQEEELKMLRRKVQETIHPPPVEITANKLLMGKNVSLESYKSFYDKQQLLDEVISTGNGDGILAVVLFLSQTLKKKLLYQILQTRPEACNHYLHYLIVRMKISEATDILTMLGRDNEVAMLQYKFAVQTESDPLLKKQRLKKVYNDYFTQSSTSSVLSQIVTSSINLLEWQLQEQSKSSDAAAFGIVNRSPIETLYYICSKFKWKDSASNDPMNPYKFVSDHQISSLQFEWTALNERGKTKAYPDLNGIFEKQTWGPLHKKQFHITIPLESAIQRLHELEAPSAVLYQFISKVSDTELRLSLAKETKCVRAIIDALVALKEKKELEEFKESLLPGNEERFYAENALKSLNKKWTTESIKLIRN